MNFINGAELLEYCEKENKKISETSFRDLGHGDSLSHLLSRFFLYDKYKANRADDGSKQDPIDHIR